MMRVLSFLGNSTEIRVLNEQTSANEHRSNKCCPVKRRPNKCRPNELAPFVLPEKLKSSQLNLQGILERLRIFENKIANVLYCWSYCLFEIVTLFLVKLAEVRLRANLLWRQQKSNNKEFFTLPTRKTINWKIYFIIVLKK